MACANLRFSADTLNPLAQALPVVVVMPLAQLPGAQPVLDVLFAEAFTPRCGGRQVVDRLFEVTLILIVRALLDRGDIKVGLLAGLADLRLAKALVAIHERPAQRWDLHQLAAVAGMSRSHFAANFHDLVGQTPADYLARYRICVVEVAAALRVRHSSSLRLALHPHDRTLYPVQLGFPG
jgi:AraC-like DNA-binding protein